MTWDFEFKCESVSQHCCENRPKTAVFRVHADWKAVLIPMSFLSILRKIGLEPEKVFAAAPIAFGTSRELSPSLPLLGGSHARNAEQTAAIHLDLGGLTGSLHGLYGIYFVISAPPFIPNISTIALANPLAGVDRDLTAWFHAHVSHAVVNVLSIVTELGSGEWIGIALTGIILFLIWKRSWLATATMIIAVPGGMLLNELLKIEVHRDRPFFHDPFGAWSGYSFASGHTVGALLLYGQLALFIVPSLKSPLWRGITISIAILLVFVVGFTRVALGAHYLTDVLGAVVFGILWLGLCVMASRPLRRSVAPVAITQNSLQLES